MRIRSPSLVVMFGLAVILILMACQIPGQTATELPLPTKPDEPANEEPPQEDVDGGAEAGDLEIVSIRTVNDPVYYDGSSCGTSEAIIGAEINGPVADAWVQYRYNGHAAGAIGDWETAAMSSLGGNRYDTTVNVLNEAGAVMNGNDGVLEFQVYAKDADGNSVVSPDGNLRGVEVLHCAS